MVGGKKNEIYQILHEIGRDDLIQDIDEGFTISDPSLVGTKIERAMIRVADDLKARMVTGRKLPTLMNTPEAKENLNYIENLVNTVKQDKSNNTNDTLKNGLIQIRMQQGPSLRHLMR